MYRRNFWDDANNRRRYMDWLGEQLGYRRPKDWEQVTHLDFIEHHCGALLNRYSSYLELLQEYLPGIDWESRVVDVYV